MEQISSVLVVDDEPSLRKAIVGMLATGGFSCVEAENGEEALRICRDLVPDLVVLDVMMPGIDGFEVIRSLRATGSCMPILVLSAKGDLSDKDAAFECGADDYLVKPFGIDELLMRVRALLRRAGMQSVSAVGIVRTGGLEIDLLRELISLDGRSLDLKPKELKILAFLARHVGDVLTKDDIVRGVWGEEYLGTSINIPVYIRHLREKIEPNPANPRYILTEWGSGYRLAQVK